MAISAAHLCFSDQGSLVSSFRALTVMTPDKRHLRGGIWEVPQGTRRAICVLLNGHTEFLEKYEEVANELRARGFEVISMDWRGQGASERRVYGNRAGHIGKFDEYDGDLIALINQAASPLGLPMFSLAHSMGANILFRRLHEQPR